jgi:hypothetical protein
VDFPFVPRLPVLNEELTHKLNDRIWTPMRSIQRFPKTHKPVNVTWYFDVRDCPMRPSQNVLRTQTIPHHVYSGV